MKILGISGSLRRNSYNTWLLQAASELIEQDIIFELITIENIPLYMR